MSEIWFTLKYRQSLNDIYYLYIAKGSEEFNDIRFTIGIQKLGKLVGNFVFRITKFWLLNYFPTSEKIDALGYLHSNAKQFLENILRDYIFEQKIENLKGKTISIQDLKVSYQNKIYLASNNNLKYDRNPQIIAKENIFARELILKQLFLLQNNTGGPVNRTLLTEKCEYYDNTIKNAITTLISKGYIRDFDGYELTFSGSMYIEEKLLSPFNNNIFLIAACNDTIEDLINKVYRPAVESFGYDLVFQEQSEPKGSIHEDIWNYIDKCSIIICDLTNKRPNCFIEYGYALAKEKQIILCVEESEGKTKNGYIKVPFDTQNQKYSFWKKEWLENNDPGLKDFISEIKDRIKMKLQILDIETGIINS